MNDETYVLRDRTILSGTEELHSRIEALTERIHQLEDALASLQVGIWFSRLDFTFILTIHKSQVSGDEPHPLLHQPRDSPLVSTGSLMIKEDGNVKYYGATSSVEWIMTLQEESNIGSSPNDGADGNGSNPIYHDPQLEALSSGLPLFTERINKDMMIERAIAELPTRELATVLVDCHYFRSAWL